MILDEILAHKREEIDARDRAVPLEAQMERVGQSPPPRTISFEPPISLIAEVKRRSPSAGDLAQALDPVQQALAYERGGACAISVLTDARYFGGSLHDLSQVRGAVSLPVLCKDFILTPYQVYEARVAGADLILLIVAALDDESLIQLQSLVDELGMSALVEAHDQHDLARALAACARLIGINNRDLSDFSVDLLTTEYLMPLAPDDVVAISESGIFTRQDVERVARAGARGVLVGETLMRSADPAATIKELLG
jgi:indole-3-glycerol phosphate synthase